MQGEASVGFVGAVLNDRELRYDPIALDPLVLVACDAKAAGLYSQAVRQEFPTMRRMRLFGREARAFTRLNTMLEQEADRQAVWHLLKTMA